MLKLKSNILKLSTLDKVFTILIFLNWLLYENILFIELDEIGSTTLKMFVFSYKLIFPLILFFYSKFPTKIFFNDTRFSIYLISFFFFIIWSFIPTFISGTLISWVKLIPILFFFISVASFFYNKFYAFILFIKIYIYYVIYALFQYIIINLLHIYEGYFNDALVGPFGLLGNTRSRINFAILPYPLIRLCGFWKEPSNAAGASFAAFFMARFLFSHTNLKFWKYISICCLIAGFLTLSNAGYLAIGLASMFGVFFNSNVRIYKKLLTLILVSPILILMIWLALFSRDYFAAHPTESVFIRAVTGIRTSSLDDDSYDPSEGRRSLIDLTLKNTKNIIGIGIQVTGPSGRDAPAGAPLFWLYLTGIPGFLFIMIREITLFSKMIKNSNYINGIIFLSQASIIIIVQESINGSWMDPNYLITSCFVLIFISFQKDVNKNLQINEN